MARPETRLCHGRRAGRAPGSSATLCLRRRRLEARLQTGRRPMVRGYHARADTGRDAAGRIGQSGGRVSAAGRADDVGAAAIYPARRLRELVRPWSCKARIWLSPWPTGGAGTSIRFLARLELLRQGAASATDRVEVLLPNRTIRRLSQGPSSILSKAVVEIFAPAFLFKPAVLLLSESGDKIVAQEERMMASIGLRIDRAKLLPDIILFDVEPDRELLVFVEVVATDGPVSEGRREALLEIAKGARVPPSGSRSSRPIGTAVRPPSRKPSVRLPGTRSPGSWQSPTTSSCYGRRPPSRRAGSST